VLGLTKIKESAAMVFQREPRTRQKTSMPPRGTTPGLKRGRNRLPYWIARQVVRDPMGFPDKCIPLPADADDAMLTNLCHEHTARLQAWIEEQKKPQEDGTPKPVVTHYDGTVYSACRIYQEHPYSHFRKVKHNTRKSYADSLKILEATVGKRLIRNLTIIDVEHWYEQWRRPAQEGGAERIDRAHDAVSMFKTVIRFNAALRRPECKLLLEELKLVKFEKGGARQEEMTNVYARSFIKTALDLGKRGIIPADRARYMAMGVAAQFELGLRQKDIIGEWRPDETWTGYFTWENVPGWRWRMKTSKSKYRTAADFDLTQYGFLFPLLDAVPHDQREGAIIKGEHGLPIRERSYRKWYRQIARAAGIPDAVWSMDARAGAATEAEEAGVPIEDIRDALTHSESRTTVRYIRRRAKKIAEVAEARARQRAADSDGTA
jgi:hypothetical protein